MGRGRHDGQRRPAATARRRGRRCSRSSDLRAYYQMQYFGIDREVRAVDDITLHVNRNEIYGLAGESSCGKTSFIKTIAAANRPPLNVVGGSVRFSFLDRDIYQARARRRSRAVRWKHLSYIMQGSMNVLNPVRRIRQVLRRLRLPAHRPARARVLRHRRARTSSGSISQPVDARRLSARALRRHAPARDDRARHHLPARVHHRRRADHRARRRGAEGRARR